MNPTSKFSGSIWLVLSRGCSRVIRALEYKTENLIKEHMKESGLIEIMKKDIHAGLTQGNLFQPLTGKDLPK
jgi:hypothetical protein